MIKINLLAEKKAAKAKVAVSGLKTESTTGTSNVLLSGILLLGVLVAGGWWWVESKQLKKWTGEVARAEQELQRLQEVRKKGEMYKKQKELLERKIQLITDLKKKQTVPVHILDQISKNLPDFL